MKLKKTRRKTDTAARAKMATLRALTAMEQAGWSLIRQRADGQGLFVARKTIREEDDTVTHLFESTYTLEDLAKQVDRRQREEGLA